MPMTWDSASQAFAESEIPKTYNQQLEAWEDTGGYENNSQLEAWEKVWPEEPKAIELPLTGDESFAKLIKSPDSAGDMVLTQNGVAPSITQSGASALYYYETCQITFDGNFEFSANIYFGKSVSALGIATVSLYNRTEKIIGIHVGDGWAGSGGKEYIVETKDRYLYNSGRTQVDRSGTFFIKRTNETIKFYHNESELGSFMYDIPIIFDRIAIDFYRYESYTMNTMYVKDIYVGPIRD